MQNTWNISVKYFLLWTDLCLLVFHIPGADFRVKILHAIWLEGRITSKGGRAGRQKLNYSEQFWEWYHVSQSVQKGDGTGFQAWQSSIYSSVSVSSSPRRQIWNLSWNPKSLKVLFLEAWKKPTNAEGLWRSRGNWSFLFSVGLVRGGRRGKQSPDQEFDQVSRKNCPSKGSVSVLPDTGPAGNTRIWAQALVLSRNGEFSFLL